MSAPSLEPQRLPNGLLWLARPVASTQAAVRVVYRCGGRDDPTGRSGMTHLVLRLVAGASRYLEPGQFNRLIASAGGRSGIEIDEDFAALQTVVPAHQLERVLWAEAERMSNPRLEPDALVTARQQLRQAVQAPQLHPYARLDLAVQRHGYLTHPYQRGALGDPEQLKDLDIDTVRAFHANRFGCDRALLVVTGAFDEAAVARWVMHYFGSIRPPMPPATASEPVDVRESRRPQSQTQKLSLAQAPLPAAALVWQVPRADDPTLPIWQLAHALLGLGRSGRLIDTLVDEKALAHQLSLRLDTHRDAGLLVAQALAAHGQTSAPVAQALQQEVLRLADEPVTDEELNKAKALLRRQTLSDDWTADRLARSLGTAWAVRGDAGAPAKDMATWVKLSGAEVQQFWRKQVVQAPVLTLLADIGAAAGVAA
ncbi:M16 family metallopeptidase [Roseateles sp. UC29_93]|uniref:M16 family metallopeptidase n=1 Tax=Roseateles sp. UC29_93 TaxID=3350177 RepID=UPI00367353EF